MQLLRRFASRNLLTFLLIAVIALLTCVNMVQARVIQMQREEVRNSLTNDFVFMNLFTRERAAHRAEQAGAAQNKKPEPAAPARSRSH
jgi:hypothetical protein